MYFRVELLKIPLFSDSSLWTEDKREMVSECAEQPQEAAL